MTSIKRLVASVTVVAAVVGYAPTVASQTPNATRAGDGMSSDTTGPLPAPGRVPPRVDPAALRLLTDVGATLGRASSLRAHTRTEMHRNPAAGLPATMRARQDTTTQITIRTTDVRYLRPNYVWQDVTLEREPGEPQSPAHPHNVTACTPSTTTVYQWGMAMSYQHHDANRCHGEGDDALAGFFDPKAEKLTYMSAWDTTGGTMNPLLRSLTIVGKETWEGKSYDVVQAVYGKAYMQPEDTVVVTRRIYVAPDHTVRRLITTDSEGNRTDHQVLALDLSTPITPSEFVWTPPDSVKVRAIPTRARSPLIGKPFPTLDLPAKFQNGRAMTLRQFLAGKKGAVLWYWATGCSGCIVEFPHLEQLYPAALKKGVEIVALDPMIGDSVSDAMEEKLAGRMRDFWKTRMPIVFSEEVTHGLSHNGINYVIVDSSGIVLEADIGMDFRDIYRTISAL